MKKMLMLPLFGMVLAAGALAQSTGVLIIGSGGNTGVYYPVAVGLGKMSSEGGLRASAVATQGSAFNLSAVATGEQQIALAQSDIAYYAYRGTGVAAFDGKPNTKLRTLATLYPEVIHVLARRDSGIASINELRGKRVVVGDAGSGTEQNSRQVLDAYDVQFSDLKEAIRVNPTQGIELINAGKADALVYTVGLGASALTQLTTKENMKVLPISGFNVRKLTNKYPFYVRFNIPRGTYRGVSTPVPTVAVQATLISSTDMSDDTIYRFLKNTLGDSTFKDLHPNLKTYFSLERASKGLPAPLHGGAVRFFREQGQAVR